ncbi:PREDICTED: uncharacterized protein LOC104813314 [Tarenaya hassleriana]|uniref:uncharacterized protein LOC104813314 n=1 Tax=Tarenaya hassleriana TaxID=28532 RepID=UPI00053C41BD|nr:PREDICTED: uncharacterized protein LOC104813314 [Tarenaya hassleriana]
MEAEASSPLPPLSDVANHPPSSLDPYSNPLYLHAADSSSISLVPEKLTGEDNYNLWSRSIVKVLIGKNKLGFLHGSVPKPADDHPDLGAWDRCNAIVGTWLTNSLSIDIATQVMYLDDAAVIWSTLETLYKQRNDSTIFHLEQQIELLQQGSMNLSTFFNKLRALWEELKMYEPYPICTCGGCTCQANRKLIKICEKKKVVKFLMKLNESYHPARRQILMIDPLPDMSRAYSMIAQEEKHRQALPPDSMVFQTSAQPISRPKSVNLISSKPRPVCSHCGLTGHTISRCYKLHGYPPASKPPRPWSSRPPLLPKPRASSQTHPVNMVNSDPDHLAPIPDSPKSSFTMEQAQALFGQLQSQFRARKEAPGSSA